MTCRCPAARCRSSAATSSSISTRTRSATFLAALHRCSVRAICCSSGTRRLCSRCPTTTALIGKTIYRRAEMAGPDTSQARTERPPSQGLRARQALLGPRMRPLVGKDPAGRVLRDAQRRGDHHDSRVLHRGLHTRSRGAGRRHESLHAAGGQIRGQEFLARRTGRLVHALRLLRHGEPDQRAA